MLRDNHWYRMLKRPNVELVTDAIDYIAEDPIVMKNGFGVQGRCHRHSDRLPALQDALADGDCQSRQPDHP